VSAQHRLFRRLLSLLIVLFVIQACTSIPVAQREDKRAQLDQEAAETIAEMLELDPAIGQELEEAAGYFVSRVSAANLAFIGGGQGIGVLVDRQSGDSSSPYYRGQRQTRGLSGWLDLQGRSYRYGCRKSWK